jgi:hypothetical protein
MAFSFARVAVHFLESVATVRDDRAADEELLELCRTGAARGSVKMREACLKAQRDRASPLVLKALVRAVSTAWFEFYEAVGTPFGFASILLFLLSSLVLPTLPWLRVLLSACAIDDEDQADGDDEEKHVIVLAGGADLVHRGGIRRRVAKLLKGRSGSAAALGAPSGAIVELGSAAGVGAFQ